MKGSYFSIGPHLHIKCSYQALPNFSIFQREGLGTREHVTYMGNHDQTESCSTLQAFEIILHVSSADYYPGLWAPATMWHLTGTTVVPC